MVLSDPSTRTTAIKNTISLNNLQVKSLRASTRLQQQQKKQQQFLDTHWTQRSRTSSSRSNIGSSFTRSNVKSRYKRKRIPVTEQELKSLQNERQAEYERICLNANASSPSLWFFESLFPAPVIDEESVQRDLFEVKERDRRTAAEHASPSAATISSLPATSSATREVSKMKSFLSGGSSMMRVWREPRLSSPYLSSLERQTTRNGYAAIEKKRLDEMNDVLHAEVNATFATFTTSTSLSADTVNHEKEIIVPSSSGSPSFSVSPTGNVTFPKIDRDLTRMVEDRIFGYRRTLNGNYLYKTSLLGDGAVQFRHGVRLGNPLPVNADRLNYFAKKELQHGRVEEAQELYERAIQIDRRDGRAFLGLCRCAQRRRDFALAREYLEAGIANSVAMDSEDAGANPYLTQALGCLEEKMGRLAQAEALYISAVRSRPCHAAAWVSLAQLRTRKLGQTASAGRYCYETAERELKKAGKPPSAYVYTAWADMEYKKAGDTKRARELFKLALKVDQKCSAAWLQLGVMEADQKNWNEAQHCFETVLKFDQRNSRAIQAYAIMEAERPDGNNRKAFDLFERALRTNPRDAGVLQAYALYVARLGDIDAARDLLRAGTEVDKRHAPVWQAWGVLETCHGSAEDARKIFQEGIWACAQLSGNQSGGYRCTRLWQAWGVLEAREKDYAAARRCFSRALDADSRNVAAVTAWALMEEQIGHPQDARLVFEQALPRFAAGSEEKVSLWRSYELMEQRVGNNSGAQQVYLRCMRETITINDRPENVSGNNAESLQSTADLSRVSNLDNNNEVEVIRWDGGGGEVWLNDRAIESKVPFSMKNRKRKKQFRP